MNEPQSPFYELACDALSQTLRLLDADSLFSLTKLCGDSVVSMKCRRLGGATEVHATNAKSFSAFVQNYPLLPSFTHLTILGISTSIVPTMPLQIFQTLPKTLRQIRLSAPFAFDCWLRSIDEANDCPEAKYSSHLDSLVPISMEEVYPNLQSLELVCRTASSTISWSAITMSYFIRHLPSDLDTLVLSWVGWSGGTIPTRYFGSQSRGFGPKQFLSLRHFHCVLGSGLWSLQSFLCDSRRLSQTEQLDIDQLRAHQLFNFGLLEWLHLTVRVSDSLALLRHLTALKNLHLKIQSTPSKAMANLALPPTLEKLDLVVYTLVSIDELVRQTPRLTVLKLYILSSRYAHRSTSVFTVAEMPSTLTNLDLKGFFGVVNFTATPQLPAALTELDLSGVRSPQIRWHELTGLTSLHLVEFPGHLDTLYPPSLRRLRINGGLNLDDLEQLPSPLEVADTTITIDSNHADLLSGMQDLTQHELCQRIRNHYLPFGFTLTDSCRILLDLLTMPKVFGAKNWDEYRSMELLCARQALSTAERPLPPRLTSLVSDSMTSRPLDVPLPETITRLSIGFGTAWLIPQSCLATESGEEPGNHRLFSRLPDASSPALTTPTPDGPKAPPSIIVRPGSGSHRLRLGLAQKSRYCKLPPSLTELELCDPIMLRLHGSDSDWSIFPILQSAPLLTTLRITASRVKSDGLNFAVNLPATLTDLSLAITEFLDVPNRHRFQTVLPINRKNWLPLLRRLNVSGIVFPLRAIHHRLDTFVKLQISHMLVQSDLIEPLHDDFDRETLSAVALSHYVLSRVLPPQARSLDTVVLIEWGRPFVERLPGTLKSLEIVSFKKPSFNFASSEFASALPRGLTYLDTTHFYSTRNINVSELPHTLTSLRMRVSSNSNLGSYFSRLPGSLVSFFVTFAKKVPLTRSIFASLPRTLQQLGITSNFLISAADTFADLPWSLSQLCLRINATNELMLPIFASLPMPLAYLHYTPTNDNPPPPSSFHVLEASMRALFPLMARRSLCSNDHGLRRISYLSQKQAAAIAVMAKESTEDDDKWRAEFSRFLAQLPQPHALSDDTLRTHEAVLRKAQSTGISIMELIRRPDDDPLLSLRPFRTVSARLPTLQHELSTAMSDLGIPLPDAAPDSSDEDSTDS